MKRVIFGILVTTVCFSFLAGAQKQTTFKMAPLPSNNMGVVQISNPEIYSRVVAISDIHGMWQNLFPLLLTTHLIDQNLNWLGGKTLMIVVGDFIDQGPDSLYVMDFLMNLIPKARAAGGSVVVLLGNDEAEFLANPANPHSAAFLAELTRLAVPLDQVVGPAFPRGAFLRSLPMAARVGQWLFVHAGLYPKMPWREFVTQTRMVLDSGNYGSDFLIGTNSPLEAKDWWKDAANRVALEANLASNGMFGVVFGNMPDAFNVVNDIAQMDGKRLIKIDSGMAPDAGSYMGHFLVFTQPAEMNQSIAPQTLSMTRDGLTHPF